MPASSSVVRPRIVIGVCRRISAALPKETRMKIAVAGKGGSGKTTIAATLARTFARRGYSVLTIDGDPNPNLATALGVQEDARATLNPLPRILFEQRTDPSGDTQNVLTQPIETIVDEQAVRMPPCVACLAS
jgi:CO dehydrogenase nickel-insertion accessory protein CooC1